MARHRTEIRRQLIVEAAKWVLAEQGLAATGARDIAAAAGISLGTLTYHFASIDELLVQVLWSESQAFEERRQAHMLDGSSRFDVIVAFLDAYFDEDVHPRAMWRIWLDCWARAPHSEGVRHWQTTRYRDVYGHLESLIRDGIHAGEFEPLDTRQCARELLALVDGLGEQLVIEEGSDSAEFRAIINGAIRRRLAAGR